jgi:S-DNA-T family DNA segregation ATPase FtsK/SpoIIIE
LSHNAIQHHPRAIEPPPKTAHDPEQITIPELINATGMRRTWIYDRLQPLAATGGARQIARGRWRA